MALKKFRIQVSPILAGKRLDQVLSDSLAQLSKGKIRKLIVAGAVYLNGKRVRIASKEMQSRACIEVFIDFDKLKGSDSKAKDVLFQMSAARILFEDEWLIAVDKPSGLPTQPTVDEARENLFGVIKRFLAEREKQTQVYLGLHHRLDRDTSGVVLLAKSRDANPGLASLFSAHRIEKKYLALTWRAAELPPQAWNVKNYLGRLSKSQRFGAVRAGGDFAHTEFRLLETFPKGLLIEARPLTGRTHQIRVHLTEGGLPIFGDSVYGRNPSDPKDFIAKRTMLHAASLRFNHPLTQKEIFIESPLPDDFSKCLERLRLG